MRYLIAVLMLAPFIAFANQAPTPDQAPITSGACARTAKAWLLAQGANGIMTSRIQDPDGNVTWSLTWTIEPSSGPLTVPLDVLCP